MTSTATRSLRGFALALCFVMVIAPVVRVDASVARTGDVRASVTVGANHAPVELITIRVTDLETAEEVALATTDEAGTVVLPDLPEGTYHVSAVAPEGFVASVAPLVTVTGEATEVAITLAPAQDGQDAETECADGDDDCVAAAAAAAAAAGGGAGTGLILLGILGAAGIAIGIAGVVEQDKDDDDVITQ
jgi:TctA family transporter